MGEAVSTCLTKDRFKIGVGKYLPQGKGGGRFGTKDEQNHPPVISEGPDGVFPERQLPHLRANSYFLYVTHSALWVFFCFSLSSFLTTVLN